MGASFVYAGVLDDNRRFQHNRFCSILRHMHWSRLRHRILDCITGHRSPVGILRLVYGTLDRLYHRCSRQRTVRISGVSYFPSSDQSLIHKDLSSDFPSRGRILSISIPPQLSNTDSEIFRMGRFIMLTYNLSALYAYSLSVQEVDGDDDEGGVMPVITEIALHRVVAVLSGYFFPCLRACSFLTHITVVFGV